jgi:hypothetical protein
MVGSRAQNLKDEYEDSWDSYEGFEKWKMATTAFETNHDRLLFCKIHKNKFSIALMLFLPLKPSGMDFGKGFQVKICFLFLIGSTVVFYVETVSWSVSNIRFCTTVYVERRLKRL